MRLFATANEQHIDIYKPKKLIAYRKHYSKEETLVRRSNGTNETDDR